MNKNSGVMRLSIVASMLWLPIANNADAKDPSDLWRAADKYLSPAIKEPSPPPAPPPSAVPAVTSVATPTAQPQKNEADAQCAVPKSAPLSILEKAQTMVTRRLIDEAAKALLKIDDLQVPESIDNVCVASKRLAYVDRYTSRWSTSVIGSIKQAKEALDLAGEAASYVAFTNDPDFAKTGHDKISRIQKDMKNDLELIQAAITQKRAANQEKLSEASASMRAALVQGSIIGGWDKVLLDFIGNNARWAFIENPNSMKMLKEHAGLLVSTATAIQGVTRAHSASSPERANDVKVAAIIKQREQENAAYEKELVAELQL